MLLVESVTDLTFMKMVRLIAPTTESCRSKRAPGGRFGKLIDVHFAVHAGERLTLPYPFWTRHAIGQGVPLSDVMRHPLGPQWTAD